MITELDALDFLNKMYLVYTANRAEDSDAKEDSELYKLLVKAINKQVPLTPIDKVNDIRPNIDTTVQYGKCPVCGAQINDFDDCRVCSTCGQKLEWKYDV